MVGRLKGGINCLHKHSNAKRKCSKTFKCDGQMFTNIQTGWTNVQKHSNMMGHMFANIQIKWAMICNFGERAHLNSRSSHQNAGSINTKKSMLPTNQKMHFQNVWTQYDFLETLLTVGPESEKGIYVLKTVLLARKTVRTFWR